MALDKRLYAGFTEFFEQPSRDTLRDLMRYGSGESDSFDFKEAWPEKAKIAKHILALANSGGGALIIGVKDGESLVATGIPLGEKVDKTDVSKQVATYMPSSLLFDIFDFDYPSDSEYTTLRGKAFQVVIVECNESDLPYLCKKGHTDLKDNVIYVRKRKESTEADHDDLQRILEKRIKAAIAPSGGKLLQEEMEHLEILYKQLDRFSIGSSLQEMYARSFFGRGKNQPEQSFSEYVNDLISRKKKRIETLLCV